MDTTHTRLGDRSCPTQLAAPEPIRLNGWPRAIVIGLASIASLISSSLISTAYAADECYRDTAGRTVARRRPGFVEVPCSSPPVTIAEAHAAREQQALLGTSDTALWHSAAAEPVEQTTTEDPLTSTRITMAYAAKECYRDTAGRIVSRRRPGFVVVPCAPQPATSLEAAAERPPEDAAAPRPALAGTKVSSTAPRPVHSPRRT